jgi:hypothetical protein
MIDVEPLIERELQRMAPRTHALPNWADVVSRSAAIKRRAASFPLRDRIGLRRVPRGRQRWILISALIAALLAVASALAASGVTPFGSIRSWLDGKPGEPASAAEQAGFSVRNDASYVAFPTSTKVRLVDETTAASRQFHLLGFTSGTSLCLRLIRADLPAGRGRNECVTLRELRLAASPALVASEADFTVNDPPDNVDGIFGFADDTVRSVQYRRAPGPWRSVQVKNNVFVALDAKRSVSRHGSVLEPIVQVRAVTRGGRIVTVPFVSGAADYTAGLPTQPSYLKLEAATPAQLPGPTKADRILRAGTIRWLVQHEPRGNAWQPASLMGQLGTLAYARAIKPDPDGSLAEGLFVIRLRSATRVPHAIVGELILCEQPLGPFSEGGGEGCFYPSSPNSLFPSGQSFVTSDTGSGGQIMDLTGAAADGVAGLKLFLASGRVVPAVLKDNAFTVSAPSDQMPGKLVAYDSTGRVLGLQLFPGPEHAVACPALPIRPPSMLPPAAHYEHINLRDLTVNGASILGASPTEVQAALGPPRRKAGFVHHGFGQPTYFYGGSLPSAPLLVRFGGKAGHYRAISLSYQGRGLTDQKLGRLLNVQPQTLEREIEKTYGALFRLTASYGSNPGQIGTPGGGCTSSFTNQNRQTTLSFGIDPFVDAHPILTLSHP